MSRTSKDRRIDPTDVLAAAAGTVVGLAIGFLAGGSVGRINRTRLRQAIARLTERRGAGRRWTEQDAERLEAAVLDALSRDVVLARRRIRVTVLGIGLVELTGAVMHTAEIGLASDVVQQVPDLRTVLNHLVVETPSRPVATAQGPNAPRAARG